MLNADDFEGLYACLLFLSCSYRGKLGRYFQNSQASLTGISIGLEMPYSVWMAYSLWRLLVPSLVGAIQGQ